MAKKKDKKKLEKEILTRKKAALQAEIGRRKLLQAVIAKKRVSVLRRIEDKIPSVFTRKDPHETTFLKKGRLI